MELLYEKESYDIRGVIFNIYKEFRNFHKELVYHNSLFNDLTKLGYKVEKNKQISIYHNNKKVGVYVPDLVINDIIVIELKCKPKVTLEDRKQFWHYLKSSSYQLGFLVNFGSSDGVEIERKIFTKDRSSV
jgi:GxxExxY protein